MTHPEFSSIEPYSDAQVPQAVARIVADPQLQALLLAINPHDDPAQAIARIAQVRTTEQFHHCIILPLLLAVVKHTATRFSYDGHQHLDPNKRYLFVSNHRDIFLDAALFNYALARLGFDTTENAIGDNLMPTPLFRDLARSGGMFPIMRGGTRREMFAASQLTSSYIRHAITEKGKSVWIAQRNGRTKDGDDRTEPGLLKMFSLSGEKDFVENLSQLNLVPVAISYEHEPCADRKAHELLIRRQQGQYTKAPGEDTASIIQGIHDAKGHIHITICPPIAPEELALCAAARGDQGLNAPYVALATLIDRRIHAGYYLHPTNIAALSALQCPPAEPLSPEEELLLHLYATPALNQQALGQ